MSNPAIIWDLNGVIIDDMHYHFLSFQAFLRELGHDMTEDYFVANCTGTPPNEVFEAILPGIGNPVSIEEAVERKRNIYFDLTRGNMRMLPGVRDLIEGAHAAGMLQAVASGATRVEVERILGEFGIWQYMGVVVACEDVSRGKPDPEPFLTAAARINKNPEDCLVIEDGEYGIRAAKSCNMNVLAVTNTQTRDMLSAADRIVDSLAELTVADIIDLVYNNLKEIAR